MVWTGDHNSTSFNSPFAWQNFPTLEQFQAQQLHLSLSPFPQGQPHHCKHHWGHQTGQDWRTRCLPGLALEPHSAASHCRSHPAQDYSPSWVCWQPFCQNQHTEVSTWSTDLMHGKVGHKLCQVRGPDGISYLHAASQGLPWFITGLPPTTALQWIAMYRALVTWPESFWCFAACTYHSFTHACTQYTHTHTHTHCERIISRIQDLIHALISKLQPFLIGWPTSTPHVGSNCSLVLVQ